MVLTNALVVGQDRDTGQDPDVLAHTAVPGHGRSKAKAMAEGLPHLSDPEKLRREDRKQGKGKDKGRQGKEGGNWSQTDNLGEEGRKSNLFHPPLPSRGDDFSKIKG